MPSGGRNLLISELRRRGVKGGTEGAKVKAPDGTLEPPAVVGTEVSFWPCLAVVDSAACWTGLTTGIFLPALDMVAV